MTDAFLEAITLELGLPIWEARNIIRSSPNRYKEFPIKKKGGGERLVAQPARETKRLQLWLVEHFLKSLPVHESCMAYVTGKGIKQNAERHAPNEFLLKMDFSNFFPSIEPLDFFKHTQKHSKTSLSEQDLILAALILFWRPKGEEKLKLCIGAPSSPTVSNTILFDFDCEISKYCARRSVTYTRYADDLTFSTNVPETLVDIEEKVKDLISKLEYPSLSINEKKTVHVSKKFARRVTGLTISNENKVSLGRDRKRLLRVQIQYFKEGKLDPVASQKLRGLLAFANDVEPEFIVRMRGHYGNELIERIIRMPFARRNST